jgi:hypothetical protein
MVTSKPTLRKPKIPHPGDLLKTIRRLVDEGKVRHTVHVLEDSMPDRGLDFDDLETILRKGIIREKIRPGKNLGEWKCLVEDKLPGNSRWTGVAVVVKESHLLIATIEWVDP